MCAVQAVVFDHVSLAFDDREILRDISFFVPAGGMTVLLGSSGAGKSVILKLILGLLRPDSGAIHVYGERIDTMTEVELTRVRQHRDALSGERAFRFPYRCRERRLQAVPGGG